MKKGTSKFFSLLLVMVLLLNMTLVVNAETAEPYMIYDTTLQYESQGYVVSASFRFSNYNISLSGSAYSSLEGVSDSLSASGYAAVYDSTYEAAWSSARCDYYKSGTLVDSRAI